MQSEISQFPDHVKFCLIFRHYFINFVRNCTKEMWKGDVGCRKGKKTVFTNIQIFSQDTNFPYLPRPKFDYYYSHNYLTS